MSKYLTPNMDIMTSVIERWIGRGYINPRPIIENMLRDIYSDRPILPPQPKEKEVNIIYKIIFGPLNFILVAIARTLHRMTNFLKRKRIDREKQS